MPEARKDVDVRMVTKHCEAVEQVVERPHISPCPNKSVDIQKMNPSDIVDKFWDEYKDFSLKLGCFCKPGKWFHNMIFLVSHIFGTSNTLSRIQWCWDGLPSVLLPSILALVLQKVVGGGVSNKSKLEIG